MDIFRSVGNFFNGIFNQDDEKKKRRQAAAQQRQTPVVRRSPQEQQRLQGIFDNATKKPQVTLGQPPKPQLKPTQVTRLNDFMQQPKPAAAPVAPTPKPAPQPAQKPSPKPSQPNWNKGIKSLVDAPGKFAKGTTDTLVDIARSIPRAAVTLGLTATGGKEYKPGNDVTKAVFGSDTVKDAPGYARQSASDISAIVTGGKEKVGDKIPAWIAAPLGVVLAGTDLAPLKSGLKTGITQTSKEIEKNLAEEASKTLGRDLTDAEKAELSKVADVVDRYKKNAEKPTVEKPIDKPVTPKADAEKLAARDKIGQSYKNTVETIAKDKNLTPQQKVDYIAETKARHVEMLKQLETSQAKATKVVDDAAKATAEQEAKAQEQVAVAQENRDAATTPPEGAATPSQAPDAEQVANDAYQSPEEYAKEQNRKLDQGSLSTTRKVGDTVKEELYDPQAVAQRYDNMIAKQAKQRGEKIAPEDTLTYWQNLIDNPGKAADTVLRQAGLVKIIKKYGAERGQKAMDFSNYRLFKDELERQSKGMGNSLGIDPQLLAEYVVNYERTNPSAVADNAILRESALTNLRKRVELGIDDPALLDVAERLQFYAPRVKVQPTEVPKMKVTGFVTRNAKGTNNRGEVSPTSWSPMSAYYNDIVNTIQGEAVARRGNIVKKLADQGQTGFEVNLDAGKLVKQRENLQNMADLSDAIKEARRVRDTIQTDIKTTKKGMGKANATATAAENKAVSLLAQMIEKAKKDPESAFRDLVARDPRYEEELRAIKAQDLSGLSSAERKAQIKYDTEQLDAKYPQPKALTKDDLRILVRRLGEDFTGTGEHMARANAADQTAAQAFGDMTGLRQALTDSRQTISDLRQQRAQTWGEIVDNSQVKETDVTEVPYYVNGEKGTIKIPADLAREYAKNNERLNAGIGSRAWSGVANAAKATWTGILSPVFHVFQIAKNVPIMWRNAEGFTGINHRALQGFVEGLIPRSKFRDELTLRGAAFENALQTRVITKETVDDIARRGNLKEMFNHPVKSFKDLGHVMNNGLAYISNAQRMAVARGAYERAIHRGIPKEQALQIAAQAPAKVFGDFNRVSQLARLLEPLTPYAGATQAGTRAMIRATKERPFETTFKDMTLIAGFTGLGAYSMANGYAYYKDMVDSGKEYELDQNLPIVFPWANKREDGTWEGVVHVPLTPDFRPFNRAVWRTLYALGDDNANTGVDVGMIMDNVFDEFTGDMARSFYDPTYTNEGKNTANGILAGSPVLDMLKTAAGVNSWTGEPLSDELTSLLPGQDQVRDNTSNAAKAFSKMIGGKLTPIQIDTFLANFGAAGDTVQAVGDEKQPNPIGNMFDVLKPLAPGKGQTDKQRDAKAYFKDIDAVRQAIAATGDKATLDAFDSLHAKKTDDQKKNLLTSAQKAASFMAYDGDGAFHTTALFEAERKLDELAQQRGEPGNPIFQLAPQELQKVLTYRSGKIYNAAKQNYTKGGEGAFTSLGLDEQWYSDFQKAESDYYDKIFKDGKDNEMRTFSGAAKPKLSPEQEALEKQYYSLPAKSAERRNFLAANPWLKDYWASTNDFTDQERKALGFNSLNGDDIYDGKTKGFGDGGNGRNDYNILNRLTDFAADVKRLEKGGSNKEVTLALQKFFAPRRGGRATVTIGGKSRGA